MEERKKQVDLPAKRPHQWAYHSGHSPHPNQPPHLLVHRCHQRYSSSPVPARPCRTPLEDRRRTPPRHRGVLPHPPPSPPTQHRPPHSHAAPARPPHPPPP